VRGRGKSSPRIIDGPESTKTEIVRGGSTVPEVLPIASRQVEVTHPLGLMMRAANSFMKLADSFESDILVECGEAKASGKSMLDLLSLAAEPGSLLTIEARGPDAEQAVAALADLVEARFHETDPE
jgi:phosphocarrier protein HPr